MLSTFKRFLEKDVRCFDTYKFRCVTTIESFMIWNWLLISVDCWCYVYIWAESSFEITTRLSRNNPILTQLSIYYFQIHGLREVFVDLWRRMINDWLVYMCCDDYLFIYFVKKLTEDLKALEQKSAELKQKVDASKARSQFINWFMYRCFFQHLSTDVFPNVYQILSDLKFFICFWIFTSEFINWSISK